MNASLSLEARTESPAEQAPRASGERRHIRSSATEKSLRVLVTTPRFPPQIGGVETHVYEVARRLARRNLDITVVTTDLSGQLADVETVEGFEVRRLPAWPSTRDYYFAPRIYSTIAHEHWDLVHCQGYHTLVTPVAMLSALKQGVPFVVTFHSGGHSSRARNALRGAQRAMLRPLLARADALIAVSKFEADFFSSHLRIPRDHFVVVPNGSNLPGSSAPAHAPAQHQTLILSVGRLERYKGHHRVIAALPRVREKLPDVALRVVGSGPYEAELRRYAERCGVDDRVEVGPIPPEDRSGISRLLSQASLVALMSEYEAHSISVIEALALGRPVLVADTSGLSEFAERGQASAIPLDSTPDETAAAIIRQIESPIVASEVHLPSWEECAESILGVYQSVIRRKSPCAS